MRLAADKEIFSKSEWTILFKELALSPRQTEVIKLLFKGHSDKQIARELKIAVPTVRTHLTRLFSRFNLQDRNELVLYIVFYFRQWCRTNGNGCPYWLSNF